MSKQKCFIFEIVVMILSLSTFVYARGLIDPTRPVGFSGDSPLIQSVIVSPGRRLALINHHYYRIGQQVLGMTIVAIEKDDVTLQSQQGIVKVPVGLEVKKLSQVNHVEKRH